MKKNTSKNTTTPVEPIPLPELLAKLIDHPDLPNFYYDAFLHIVDRVPHVPTLSPAFFQEQLSGHANFLKAFECPTAKDALCYEPPSKDKACIARSPEPSSLAVRISSILNDPELPVEIQDTFMQGFSDIFNSLSNQSTLIEYEKSPEYIHMLMASVRRSQA